MAGGERVKALRDARDLIAQTQDKMSNWSSDETARWLDAWPGGEGPSVAEWLAVQFGMGRAVRLLEEMIEGAR